MSDVPLFDIRHLIADYADDQEKMGRPPAGTFAQAYTAVTHWLQAVDAAKTTQGKEVATRMRRMPVTAPLFTNLPIRPNGRVVYDLQVMRLKGPTQSTGKFDIAEVVGTIAGDKVFKPIAQTECKVV